MNMNWTGFKLALAGLAAWLVLGACIALRDMRNEKTDRGVVMNHPKHAEEGLECLDCHEFTDQATEAAIPKHDLCSMCHDFDAESPTQEECGFCHDRPGFAVHPFAKRLSSEVNFAHATHVDAGLACAECHGDGPKPRPMPSPQMPVCVKCHSETGSPELLECENCHKEIRQDRKPEFRAGLRILHDSESVWSRVHGREARVDSNFCGRCHQDEQAFCSECHRIEKPSNHNVASWNRRTHGLHASWDRDTCSVCHEEDSCMRCHSETQPTSHRGSFTPPRSTHCVQCHFPPESNCTTCHRSIDHRTAILSPHAGAVFTGTCSDCHPAGMPGRPPHLDNPAVDCNFCHQ